MRTQEEAVAFLNAQGLHAKRRKWSLGDCVVIAWGPEHDTATDTTVYASAAWLVPQSESEWDLVQIEGQQLVSQRYATLAEACAAGLELVHREERVNRARTRP